MSSTALPFTVALTDRMHRRKRERRASETPEEDLPFLEWSIRIPEPKTGTLNFNIFPFQPEIYNVVGDDRYRDVIVRKSTQVGMSALLVRWGMYEPDRNGRTMLYVFPTQDDMYDFADLRITPMVEGSEYLSERAGEPWNKGAKRIGAGMALFRGSESKRRLDSADVDCLALDEYDTLNQANIPDALRRLSAPTSAGLVRRVGVPSLPEFGISDLFERSDRRLWLVQCKHCDYHGTDRERGGEKLRIPRGTGWQTVDFWDNVDQERKLVVCGGCAEPLQVGKGRWVAQNPDSEIPGFHTSRLLVPGIRLDTIIESSRKTTPYEVEVFYNKDLGMPYVSKVARLAPEEIAACQREFSMLPGYLPKSDEYVTMGVDVASERALNVRVSAHVPSGHKIALWIGEVEDGDEGLAFDQLSLLMDRYNVAMCGIDAMPESRLARAFQQYNRGRVYLMRYSSTQKQTFVVNEEMGEASVIKWIAVDAMVEQFRRQLNLLPIALPEGYVSHLTANIRRVIVDPLGEKKTIWQPTRPDDYAMAEVYDLLAEHLYLLRQRVAGQLKEDLQPLDEMVDLRRYDLTPEAPYHPGPTGIPLGGGMYDSS